tara:strand:+ start:94 stop:990 length:897 start_codon:yes stop_codon:yes gene_type:complete
MYFINSADVELTSIAENRPTDKMAKKVLKRGLPRLLDLYSKYDVEATLFFTGDIVEKEPGVVDITKDRGHEIGCHGYTHYSTTGFDVMSFEEQVKQLRKSKKIIEEVGGSIKSFRSPELRINADTIKALEKTGFSIDSSVSSQRFDGPLSYGTGMKFNWLSSPRGPYIPSKANPFVKGDSKILEIPVSALIFPYITTTMRISPPIFRSLESFLLKESLRTEKPVVLLTHPNECIYERPKPHWSSGGPLSFIRDNLRTKLKLKNLGNKAIKQIEETLNRAKNDFEFVSMKTFSKKNRYF